LSLGAAESQPADRLLSENEKLRAENAALWSTANRLTAENKELKAEVQKLRALLEKALPDKAEAPGSSPKEGEEPANATEKTPNAGNTAIGRAINDYVKVLTQLFADRSLTDIQRKTKWLALTQELDSVLRANRIVVSYTIKDVQFDPHNLTALIECSSACIKSSDETVPDVVLLRFYEFRIVATEVQATKISPKSTMTVAGSPALNVDFSKPAGSQPAIYWDHPMPGYRRLAYVPVKEYESGAHSYTTTILIRDNCSVTVDGVRRTLPVTKAQEERPRTANQDGGHW
jgi:regulator of replication initiation timing